MLTTMPPVLDPKIGPSQIHPSAFVDKQVQVGRGARVGPRAVLLGQDADALPATTLADEVVIGANATVLPGCQIGLRARIAPGAVVTRDVPPLAIVEGNPARIVGYVNTPVGHGHPGAPGPRGNQDGPAVAATAVGGVSLHALKRVADLRGALSPGDFDKDVPFVPKRYFLVYNVPTSETRGEHAHHRCKQFLIAVSGSLKVLVDDGQNRSEFVLEQPNQGLYIPPLVWGVQYRYQPNTVLLVFASDPYDSADYIRDYATFLQVAQQARQGAFN